MKIVAAMSGGVDSAVAAARAHEAGHDVTGIHLALSRNPASYRSGARGCCTLEDANDARRAADVIGIPFYVWDLSERFHADVVEDFMDEYAAGRTPNPCLRCNEKIKFAAVLDRALALGFDAVATGHYAQLRTAADGSVEMHRAVDHDKDQSYVLGVLTQDQLSHSLFPLGDTPKSAIREEAARRGLLVAEKPDSHDICFVADGDNAG
jgi:tRNA-uridine 2-sulfurtransferase